VYNMILCKVITPRSVHTLHHYWLYIVCTIHQIFDDRRLCTVNTNQLNIGLNHLKINFSIDVIKKNKTLQLL